MDEFLRLMGGGIAALIFVVFGSMMLLDNRVSIGLPLVALGFIVMGVTVVTEERRTRN